MLWPCLSLFPCRYLLQPAVFDACIHLAPVPAAGSPIAVTRVPVAAGSLLLPAIEGKFILKPCTLPVLFCFSYKLNSV